MITLCLSPDPSHRWVTMTVGLMPKARHLGLIVPQRITQLHLRNISDRRIEIRGALFSPSRCPLICRRLPSTAGRPLRISTHLRSIKTGKSRFPARLAGRRSQQAINSESAERTRTKTLWNNRPPVVIAERKRSQRCSGDSDDLMVYCSSSLLLIPRILNWWFSTLRENCCTRPTSTPACCIRNHVRRVTRGCPDRQSARHRFQVHPVSGVEEGRSRGGHLQAQW